MNKNALRKALQLADSLINDNICDLDPYWTKPMRQGCATCRGPKEVLGKARDLWHALGRHCRATNMQLENLLNVIKAAVPATRQKPTAERVCYAGVLAQVMKSHIDQTGVDPRKVSRAVVEQAGAPLKSKRGISGKRSEHEDLPQENNRLGVLCSAIRQP